ncbi:MAG: NAD-dependent epimerase/dehydratase family protein [Nitrososphaerales archaeon]|jgi:UDP-glucose 4-epimerase
MTAARPGRALVTGGAGFVGSHIVDELLHRGIETVVLDDLSSGTMDNLAQNLDDPRLRVIHGRAAQADSVLGAVGDVDVVFHEAAIASVPRSVEDPVLVHRVNVDETVELMNACVGRRVKRFIFASSAAVYGTLDGPSASEDLLCRPVSPYGASKLAVETYLSAFYRTYGLETVGLRYFNVYGPRQRPNDYSGVITTFIKSLLAGTAPTIYGDGLQTRDFVFVRDIVQANMLAMESGSSAGEVFNVASGTSSTILELLEVLRALTGTRDVQPRFEPPRAGDVRSGSASISKIRRTLGYEAAVELRDGLAEVIEYIRDGGPVRVTPYLR